MTKKRTCSIEGCTNLYRARGYCATHYWKYISEAGAPLLLPRGPQRERFERRIDKQENGCWLWTGYINSTGYGTFNWKPEDVDEGKSRPRLVHRIAYSLYVGKIPEGMHLDHLCRITRCVNPDHLQPVTGVEHAERTRSRLVTCPTCGSKCAPERIEQ